MIPSHLNTFLFYALVIKKMNPVMKGRGWGRVISKEGDEGRVRGRVRGCGSVEGRKGVQPPPSNEVQGERVGGAVHHDHLTATSTLTIMLWD